MASAPLDSADVVCMQLGTHNTAELLVAGKAISLALDVVIRLYVDDDDVSLIVCDPIGS